MLSAAVKIGSLSRTLQVVESKRVEDQGGRGIRKVGRTGPAVAGFESGQIWYEPKNAGSLERLETARKLTGSVGFQEETWLFLHLVLSLLKPILAPELLIIIHLYALSCQVCGSLSEQQ